MRTASVVVRVVVELACPCGEETTRRVPVEGPRMLAAVEARLSGPAGLQVHCPACGAVWDLRGRQCGA